jgi:hypothetical protein
MVMLKIQAAKQINQKQLLCAILHQVIYAGEITPVAIWIHL